MPFWLHLTMVILLTAYFVYRFIRDRHIYEFLFIIWVPSTLLQYVSNDPTFLRVLGIAQVVLFILVVFFMFRRRGAARKKTAEILAAYATGDLDSAMKKNQSVIKQDENTEAVKENEEKQ